MMATAHTLVAGAIAFSVRDPILAPTLSLASHFLLDSIPHWDFGADWRNRTKYATGTFAIIDTLFGLTLAYVLFEKITHPSVLIPSLIYSLIPDWLEAPWYIFFANPKRIGPKPYATILEKISYYFYKLTNFAHTKAPFPWGFITQIATVIFFLLLLLRF